MCHPVQVELHFPESPFWSSSSQSYTSGYLNEAGNWHWNTTHLYFRENSELVRGE